MIYAVEFRCKRDGRLAMEHHLAEREGHELVIVTEVGKVLTLEDAWYEFKSRGGEHHSMDVSPVSDVATVQAEPGWMAEFKFNSDDVDGYRAEVVAWRILSRGDDRVTLDAVVCDPHGDQAEVNSTMDGLFRRYYRPDADDR